MTVLGQLLEKILPKRLPDLPGVLNHGAAQGEAPGTRGGAVIESMESDAHDSRKFRALRAIVKDLHRGRYPDSARDFEDRLGKLDMVLDARGAPC